MTIAQLGALGDRTVGTAATLTAVGLVAALAWRAGPWLRSHLDDELAEAVQSGIVTLAGAAAAVVLVDVWGLADEVRLAFLPVLDGTTAVRAMVSLLVLATGYTLTRVTKRFVVHGYRRDAISRHQREVGHHLLQLFVLAVAVLLVLAIWGVEPTNLLLGAGAFGLVVGLAARQTLRSVLAGFVLLASRPFQVGDWVEIRDEEGVVTDVTVFNTRLRTFDGEVVTIPNDAVTSGHVVNRSTTGRLRISVDVGIDYDADVGEAVAVAEDAMADVSEVCSSPSPEVVLDRFGDSAVVLGLRFWIDDPTVQRKWAAQNAVLEAVKADLEAAGIDIPFPQRVVSSRDRAAGRDATGEGQSTPADGSPEEGATTPADRRDGAGETDASRADPDADGGSGA